MWRPKGWDARRVADAFVEKYGSGMWTLDQAMDYAADAILEAVIVMLEEEIAEYRALERGQRARWLVAERLKGEK